MRIGVDEARGYFAHPSQRNASVLDPADLHEDGLLYYADGGVCLIFHRVYWPGVWMVHLGANPAAWGRLDGAVLRLLREFSAQHEPTRIVAWVSDKNRAVLALSRRLGFQQDGQFPGVELIGWTEQ